MSDCSKHKKDLFGETDMKKVADAIGDLHYKSLYDLLDYLIDKLFNDAHQDKEGGRIKLSDALYGAGCSLYEAKDRIEDAWEISKPFMTQTKDT